jgi:hypothetical protein
MKMMMKGRFKERENCERTETVQQKRCSSSREQFTQEYMFVAKMSCAARTVYMLSKAENGSKNAENLG